MTYDLSPLSSDMDDQKSFSIEKDHTVHSWYVFSLIRRVLRGPRNELFERTFLDSPGAVATLAVDAHNNVVLVRQYRATINGYLWEIPAGMRDVEGEEILVTAQRELREEAGIVAQEWKHLGSLTSAAGVTNSVVELFLATTLNDVPIQPHGPEEEEMTIARVSFNKVHAMVTDGRITDSKTVIAVLLASQKFPELL